MERFVVHLECHHGSMMKPKRQMPENLARCLHISAFGRDWNDMSHRYGSEVFRGNETGNSVAECCNLKLGPGWIFWGRGPLY